MAFVDLPGELICYVMHHAPAPSTASAASQTCKNARENLHAFMRELQLKHELDKRIAGCINGMDPMFRLSRMHIESKLESWAASAVSCKQYLLSHLLLMMKTALSGDADADGEAHDLLDLASDCGTFAARADIPEERVEELVEELKAHEEDWYERATSLNADAGYTHMLGLPESEDSELLSLPAYDAAIRDLLQASYLAGYLE